jgi:hypothetical protein
MGIISFFKGLVNKEEEKDNLIENSTVNNVELEIDDEDRIVVAIAASIMAGKDKRNSQFHISKIRRIK